MWMGMGLWYMIFKYDFFFFLGKLIVIYSYVEVDRIEINFVNFFLFLWLIYYFERKK